MRKIRLGTFFWPENPETYSLKLSNNIVEHRYPDSNYVSLETTHSDAREMGFEGEFIGPQAYDRARALLAVCGSGGLLTFEHPLYPTMTVATASLELAGEPRENYVKYSLSLKRHLPIGAAQPVYTPDPDRKPVKTRPGAGNVSYTVPQGGTLFSMAKQVGGSMSVFRLAALNRDAVSSITRMAPGQVLTVPLSELKP